MYASAIKCTKIPTIVSRGVLYENIKCGVLLVWPSTNLYFHSLFDGLNVCGIIRKTIHIWIWIVFVWCYHSFWSFLNVGNLFVEWNNMIRYFKWRIYTRCTFLFEVAEIKINYTVCVWTFCLYFFILVRFYKLKTWSDEKV